MAELPDGTQAGTLGILGLFGAAIVGLLLIPPRPVNMIPVIESPPDFKTRLNVQRFFSQIKPVRMLFTPTLKGPTCTVREYRIMDLPYLNSIDKELSRQAQLFLEEQKEVFQECIAFEKAQDGAEKTTIETNTRELVALEKARDDARQLASKLGFDASLSASMARAQALSFDPRMRRLRMKIEREEQEMRTREYELSELTRFTAWLDSRLQDPERLRPQVSIMDYLKSFSDHISAFIALGVGVGSLFKLLIDPLGAGAIYSALFKGDL